MQKNKKIVLILAPIIAAILIITMTFNQVVTGSGLPTYTGKLTGGSSYLPFGGTPTVELRFEDGKTFTCPEQLAKDANVTIGQTYIISYNATEPTIALKIQKA